MAGKSWHPSHELPHGRERKQAPVTLITETVERGRGEKQGGAAYEKSPCAQENANAHETLITVNAKCYNTLTCVGPREVCITMHS